MKVRTPPHSTDAEQAVLGGLMLAPEKLDAVLSKISPEDFYRKDHTLIFRAMMELAAKGVPCDAVTLSDRFDSTGISNQVGGSAYVFELANATPSAANILSYADIVAEKAMLRRVIDIATTLQVAAFDGSDGADKIVDGAVASLMSLHQQTQNNEWTMQQACKLVFDALAYAHANPGVLPGVPSGFADIDAVLGGFHPGDLVIIAGRPAMGKTAFLLNLAHNAGSKGFKCGIFSGEQGILQIGQRMVGAASRVPAQALRTGNLGDSDWPRITDAMAMLRGLPIRVYDESAPHISTIGRIARRWVKEYGITALYMDYLQRFGADGETRHERIGSIAFGLKDLARKLGIAIVCFAQVNRECEKRENKRPNMSDLADSSEIEKEADVVAMMYRDEYYNPDSEEKGVVEINIEKNRHGPTGGNKLVWNAECMRFENYAYYE